MNVFVPMAAVPGLSVPPMAITDGSADPVWVALPSRGGYLYGRRRLIRLPLDPAAAALAHRWLRHERRRRLLVTPIFVTLLLVALVTVYADIYPMVFVGVLALNAAGQFWVAHVEKKVTVAQHPEMIGRLGIYLPAVPAAVAGEWVRRNAAVQVVAERPRWRRYPSLVYRWAAGSYAVVAAGVWWFALRDGEFPLLTLFAFVALVTAAVWSAFKALPLGLVRFDDAPGHGSQG